MKNSINIKVLFLVLLALTHAGNAYAQEVEIAKENQYQLVNTIEVEVALLSTDKLQNIFVINKKGEVIKYTAKGEELARFNEFSLGMPGHIDATNPFQILLFYPDHSTVIMLDNTLSKIADYDLFDLDLDFIENICFSNDGNIWLYDATSFQIKKIDRHGEILLASQELSLVLDNSLTPNFLLERNNNLYIADKTMGILVFDVYGQYIRTLPIKEMKSFQVLGQQLLYFQKGNLNALHLQSLTTLPIVLPEGVEETDFVRIEKGRLFVAGSEKLRIFEY